MAYTLLEIIKPILNVIARLHINGTKQFAFSSGHCCTMGKSFYSFPPSSYSVYISQFSWFYCGWEYTSLAFPPLLPLKRYIYWFYMHVNIPPQTSNAQAVSSDQQTRILTRFIWLAYRVQ